MQGDDLVAVLRILGCGWDGLDAACVMIRPHCLQIVGAGGNGWSPSLNGSSKSHGDAAGGSASSSTNGRGGHGGGNVQQLREQVCEQTDHFRTMTHDTMSSQQGQRSALTKAALRADSSAACCELGSWLVLHTYAADSECSTSCSA